MTTANVRIHAVFHGRVQGVFFRARTQEFASEEGVTGWVRNLADGTVEAVFEGEEEVVRRVLQRCRTGVSAARVTKVEEKVEEYRGEFREFLVERGL